MAIKVINIKTDKVYYLLGTGYGMSQSARSSVFGGDLFPTIEEDTAEKVTVCDEYGKIIWFESSEIRVVSIDGEQLKSDSLDEELHGSESVSSHEILECCPACGSKVGDDDFICPDCELSLR